MARSLPHVVAGAAGLGLVLAVVAWSVVAASAARPPRPPAVVAAPSAPAPSALNTAAAPATPGTAATPSADVIVVPSATPDAVPPGVPVGPPVVAADWLERTAAATGVPGRALQAYAVAATVSAAEDPGCGLAWPTLAAIGWVESHHGTIEGRTLDPTTGRPSRPVVGVALSGAGVALITDSDDGVLDGDPALDRAVGPMQFIPTTWARWDADADADGRRDPQDLDDAALSAARYLCASGADLSTAEGWATALLSYNRSGVYVQQVTTTANAYATRSRG